MRIAIISDIHGNLPALEAVIADARACGCGEFLFAGDYIFDMPFSNGVAELLMGMERPHIIAGNKEGYLEGLARDNQDNWTHDQFATIYQTFRELTPRARSYLSGLPGECRLPLDGAGELYAVHFPKGIAPQLKENCGSSAFRKRMLASPFTHSQFLESFSETLRNGEVCSAIGQLDADVVVFGHNHLQAYGYCGGKLVINPGSCGQPLDFDTAAPYTILDTSRGELVVEERRVPYDIGETIDLVKQTRIYQKGGIWSELVLRALATARDCFGPFFAIARDIASAKKEEGAHFTNQTWNEAYEVYKAENPEVTSLKMESLLDNF